jgi:hypothetical protein
MAKWRTEGFACRVDRRGPGVDAADSNAELEGAADGVADVLAALETWAS